MNIILPFLYTNIYIHANDSKNMPAAVDASLWCLAASKVVSVWVATLASVGALPSLQVANEGLASARRCRHPSPTNRDNSSSGHYSSQLEDEPGGAVADDQLPGQRLQPGPRRPGGRGPGPLH